MFSCAERKGHVCLGHGLNVRKGKEGRHRSDETNKVKPVNKGARKHVVGWVGMLWDLGQGASARRLMSKNMRGTNHAERDQETAEGMMASKQGIATRERPALGVLRSQRSSRKK